MINMLWTNVLIIALIAAKSAVARDEYAGGIFYRTDSSLVEVPSDIPSEATEVYLKDNKITVVRTGVFSHLSVCTKLSLKNNSIATIEGNAFSGMSRLHRVLLHQNELTILEKSMFKGLDSLTYLDIDSNQINTIQSGCFSDLNNLVYLYLGNNKLTEISANMWFGLESLRNLRLNDNDIAQIKPGDFDHLPQLVELLLQGKNVFPTISYTIFNTTLYPDTDGHPSQIMLGLGSVECDSNLCWLKQGERLGWITWFAWSPGGKYYPDCVNYHGTWLDIDLNCPENDECTTYIESQCESKCESSGRQLEFNADSTCPCKCSCQEFDQPSCAMKCQEEGKHAVLGARDQFDCLNCECSCPPFNNNTCHSQCELETKIQVPGAKNRFGCDICQCGCLNRDCDSECGDLEYQIMKGNHGCTVGCQCICPDDCEPNCHGCVSKDDPSLADQSKVETKENTVTVAVSVVGALIGGIVICGVVILLCLKRKGMKPFKPKARSREKDAGDTNHEAANVPSQPRNTESVQYHEYDEIEEPAHLNEIGSSVASGITMSVHKRS